MDGDDCPYSRIYESLVLCVPKTWTRRSGDVVGQETYELMIPVR